MRRPALLVQLIAPCVLIVAVGLLGTVVSASSEGYFVDTLVKVSIVVALYVFIGNSGVLSFGHISFVALGAWTAGVLSVPDGGEAGDHAEPRALPARDDGRERARRSCLPHSPAVCSRSWSGSR